MNPLKYHNKGEAKFYKTFRSVIVMVCIIIQICSLSGGKVYASNFLNLPAIGTMVTPTPDFIPAHIKGMKIFPDNPLRFDFIIDTGHSQIQGPILESESSRLIKYFLACLTVPEDELWVNLSPYEKNRIIPEKLGTTEMGRDLLSQDYLLKQLTTSLICPEGDLGKAFWSRVYEKINKRYGMTDIPINTFNKVWIVPQKALVYASGDIAFIVESRLKVMLESDYFALKKNTNNEGREMLRSHQQKFKAFSEVTDIIREVIIPEIEKEVNQGEHFALLRQIYHSMILATWFKRNVKTSLLGRLYVGENKVKGVDIKDEKMKEKIYQKYLRALKGGVYDYIKEDYDSVEKKIIPRQYFSGGMEFMERAVDAAMLVEDRDRLDFLSEIPPADGELNTVITNLAVVNGSQDGNRVSIEEEWEKNMVPFVGFVSAIRNHIGRSGSTLYEKIKARILKRMDPIESGDNIGNISNVEKMGMFIDEHFTSAEEAVREIIANAYDSMSGELDPLKREVDVWLSDRYLQVSDTGKGMSLETILEKFYPQFAGAKSSEVLFEIRDIIADDSLDKVSRIKGFVESFQKEALSDTEKAVLGDIGRTLNDSKMNEGEQIKVIESLVTFTGQFGIGFESLLYFVKSQGDFIEIVTSTGEEAYRIKFLWFDGRLQTGVDVLSAQEISIGTKVTLKSRNFRKEKAWEVINKYLSFNTHARINVRADGEDAVFINKEAFNPRKFEHVEDPFSGVEAYYSKAKSTDGKAEVLINVHGVTILTKEVEGYGLPDKSVFNFPAQIGLPISRNGIKVDSLFLQKAVDMIELIALQPELLSAFYPLIAVLESRASASSRNVLAKAAADAAYFQWMDKDLVFLPNEAEYAKVKGEKVALVDGKLMEALSLKGFRNGYEGIGEKLWFSSEEAKVGSKAVYLVDFKDKTKFVEMRDLVLLNRRYAPKVDSEKALYNVLFELKKEKGRFAYHYKESLAEQKKREDQSSGSTIQRAEHRVKKTKEDLHDFPDEISKIHFERIGFHSMQNKSLRIYVKKPKIFIKIYNRLRKSSLMNIPLDDWTNFYSSLLVNNILQNSTALDFIFENEKIKRLQKYFLKQNNPEIMIKLLKTLVGKNFNINEKVIPMQVLDEELDRLWELRYFLNKKTLYLITSATLFDYETYQQFKNRLIKSGSEINFFSETEWKILNEREDYDNADLSGTIPFQLFFDGNISAIKKISKILRRLDFAYESQQGNIKLAISMKNMAEDEIQQFLDRGGYLGVDTVTGYTTNVLLYYFRFFYGNTWKEKLNLYLQLKMRGTEIWSLDKIMMSNIPIKKKKEFLEGVIKNVSISDKKTDDSLEFSFDFSPESLSKIENPSLFIHFISGLLLCDKEFLYKKYSLDQRVESIPFGYQYGFRYKKELLDKLITVFRHVSHLPRDEYNRIREDFHAFFQTYDSDDNVLLPNKKYRKKVLFDYHIPIPSYMWISNPRRSLIPDRICMYIEYLLNSYETTRDIKNQEIEITPVRQFSLVALYDTFLANSSGQEEQEKVAAASGDFTLVDQRIDAAVQQTLKGGSPPEREKFLRNTFKAATEQGMDILPGIGFFIEHVLKAAPKGSGVPKISINTYRKQLESGEELIVLDMEDSLGMSAEQLFNEVLMPFSSEQNFFALFTSPVMIKTVKDGKVRILKITPQAAHGHIVDFSIEEERRDAFLKEDNTTHIQLQVKADLIDLEATRMSVVAKKYAILVDPKKLILEVNGEETNNYSHRRLAVEKTRYGDVEFFSFPGESFIALRRTFVGSIDDDLMDLIPLPLRKALLEKGFAINFVSHKIRRIQGGSDIADKERVYEGSKDAIFKGAVKLAIEMFSHGDIRSLDLFGDDYYKWTYDPRAAQDGKKIINNSAGISKMREKYFSFKKSNQLFRLLLSVPLDFLHEIFGHPLSLAELFDMFKESRRVFTDVVRQKLPRPIREALSSIENNEKKEQSQGEEARNLGVPDGLINRNFSLPYEQGQGMGAYWAFIEMSSELAQVAIEGVLEENSAQALGRLKGRLEYLRDHPPQAQYYAQANKMSGAHAHQGGQSYAWNLLEMKDFLKLFSKYINGKITDGEFSDKVLEWMIKTLTHELVHIIEESAEGTHNKIFYDRQEILISALIGAKEKVSTIVKRITSDPQYANNVGDVSLQEFLRYVDEYQQVGNGFQVDSHSTSSEKNQEAEVGPGKVELLDEAMAVKKPGGIDLNPNILDLQTQGGGVDFSLATNLKELEIIQIDGFSPVILQIVPTNLPALLGVLK